MGVASVLLPFSLILFSSLLISPTHGYGNATMHRERYDLWQQMEVEHLNHFIIDSEQGSIIAVGKNYIYKRTLSLESEMQLMTSSRSQDYSMCLGDLRSVETCQNYQHVLMLGPKGMTDRIFTCGSNAFRPWCYYRHRSNLSEWMNMNGAGFCPFDMTTNIFSLWTSGGVLMSATATQAPPARVYALTATTDITDNSMRLSTQQANAWIHESSQFVSMFEDLRFIYLFFREKAIEAGEQVVYSRVSRVCKNDSGALSVDQSGAKINIFTTFLKARMSCSVGDDLPFFYNNLYDTFFFESNSNYSGAMINQHLYAVFSNSVNGPVGSVLCVYTFGSHTNDLDTVFEGDYLKLISLTETAVIPNYSPVICHVNRSREDAEASQLMRATALQLGQPLLQLSGYEFRKLAVHTTAIGNGTVLPVFFIAAYENDKLVLVKLTHLPSRSGSPHHISEVVALDSTKDSPQLTQMKLEGSGSGAHLYLGLTNGIYRIPVANCSQYSECCECVEARDPYCGFDPQTQLCTPVTPGNSDWLLHDVLEGESAVCSAEPSSPSPSPSPSLSPSTSPSTSPMVKTSIALPLCTDAPVGMTTGPSLATGGPAPSLAPPGGVSPATLADSHTWTIVGAVSGFIGGVVLGIIVAAIVHNRRNFWLWNRCFPDRECDLEGKDVAAPSHTGKLANGAARTCKEDEYTMNNSQFAPQSFTAVAPGQPTISPNPLHTTPRPDKTMPPRYVSIPKPHPSAHTRPNGSPVGEKSVTTPTRPAPPIPLQFTQSLPLSSPHPPSLPLPPSHSQDPNIKQNTLRREKHVSNYEREQYRHNLTRTPSLEPKKVGPLTPQAAYGFSWDRRLTHVEVHADMGVSEC